MELATRIQPKDCFLVTKIRCPSFRCNNRRRRFELLSQKTARSTFGFATSESALTGIMYKQLVHSLASCPRYSFFATGVSSCTDPFAERSA